MAYETILTDIDDGILTITLNRPERLNAWTYAMAGELREAMDAARAEGAGSLRPAIERWLNEAGILH